MTLNAVYRDSAGSVVSVPIEWLPLPLDKGLTENANGQPGTGAVLVDDPNGEVDLLGWVPFNVEEDDCDIPRMFTGYVWGRSIGRGPYQSGVSRQWNVELIDLNTLLHLHVLRDADANRPRESGSDRLDWLLTTTGMASIVHDNGQIMANSWIYDATDYRGKYADDVLRDIVSANTDERWTFFLYFDPPTEEVSLFYGSVLTTTYDASIRISNVIADQDGDTVYPSRDAELTIDASDQYGGVYVTGPFGRQYLTDPTTIASMGFTRDGTYSSDRLKNTETANRHGASYLGWHATEDYTIDVTIELPKERVNHILPGNRVSVRFTHLPGYESFTDERVVARSVVGLSADRSTYTVRLRLSLHGVLQPSGGGGGGLPLPPTTCADGTAEQVWGEGHAEGGGVEITSFTPAATPVVGNTRFVYAHRRGTVAIDAPIGFTDCGEGAVHPAEEYGAVFYRINQDGDSAEIEWAGGTNGPHLIYVEERAGQLTPVTSSLVSTDPYNTNSPFPGSPITPTAGRLGAIVGYWFAKRDHGALSADTGWALLEAATTDSVTTHAVIEKVVTSTSGTYTPSFTGANPAVYDNHSYGAITLALLCDASGSDNPPAPGQWVFQETVTMAGDTGTTLFPYAPGSLHVYVDGIPISSASYTQTDPSAGEFTLSWTPDADEVVRVDYQGL